MEAGGGATARVYHAGLDSWATLGRPSLSSGDAEHTDVALSAAGVLHVAYSDHSRGGSATVMRLVHSKWMAVGHAGFSPGACGWGRAAAAVLEGACCSPLQPSRS